MLADTASHQHRTIDFNSRPWLLVNDYDPATAGLSNLPAGLVLRGLADLAELQVPLLDEILR